MILLAVGVLGATLRDADLSSWLRSEDASLVLMLIGVLLGIALVPPRRTVARQGTATVAAAFYPRRITFNGAVLRLVVVLAAASDVELDVSTASLEPTELPVKVRVLMLGGQLTLRTRAEWGISAAYPALRRQLGTTPS